MILYRKKKEEEQHIQGNPLPGTDGYATDAEHTQKHQHEEYNYV